MNDDKSLNKQAKIRREMFVWLVLLAVMAAIAVADVGQVTVVAAAGESVYADAGIESDNDWEVSEDISSGGAIQSITFKKDMRIRDALRFLAAKYQKNIVPSAKIDGMTPVTSLYDVTFDEALNAILSTGMKYEQEGNFIRVYTAEEYKKIKEDKDRMTYKVYTLYYLSAAEAVQLIAPVLSSLGQVKASSAAVTGISTGREGVTGQAGGDSMALNDAVVVYDFPERLEQVAQMLKALDIRPKQVLIEATILSATLTEGMEFGVDWNLLNGVSLDGTAATQDYVTGDTVSRGSTATSPIEQLAAGFAGAALESTGFAKVAANGLRIGITSGDLIGFITALESVTDITVLANPKILALNKQHGTVFIGQKIGYRDRTTISDTGQATVGEVKFLDTGTKLSFRPYIADDGYIRMDIYPKDSSGELDEEGIPRETTAELVTNIMVRDGETIVIGGLFRDAIVSSRSQVPLLGDLPLIGAAFRGTTDSVTRQEVIVMLTPHIISESEDTDAAARIGDVERKRCGARMGLQWISRARLAEDRYTKAVSYYADGNGVEALCELDGALELRPGYLEAMRLKERVVKEMSGGEAGQIERIMLGVIEQEEAPRWRRW